MPNPFSKSSYDDFIEPNYYPKVSPSATSSLREKILAKIHDQGGLSFPSYLEIALYDPEMGYYSRPSGQVGRRGDFYTSVSVGPLFGKLLARRFIKWWEENKRPSTWRILEIGANDGQLAEDLLSEISKLCTDAWKGLEYGIQEPLPHLRTTQRKRLNSLANQLQINETLAPFLTNPLPGIVFGNEVLDALPFHLIEKIDNNWQEFYVVTGKTETLQLQPRAIAAESKLASQLKKIGTSFPNGYRTEIRSVFEDFISKLSQCLVNGLLLFVDYGFARADYYDELRTKGTLRTFSKHRAGEDPLADPGEKDITAHVDFTDLAEAGILSGYLPSTFSNQGSYLTHLAKEMILNGELNEAKTISQFQTLTHPAHLGGKFHIIEMTRTETIPANLVTRLQLSSI